MDDIVERLKAPMTMSMFMTQADLYKEAIEQRSEAAKIIEVLRERGTELEGVLSETRDGLRAMDRDLSS